MKKRNRKVIGFDGRSFFDKHYTGVNQYAIALLRKMCRKFPKNEYVIFLNGFKGKIDWEKKMPWLKRQPNISIKRFFFPSKLLNFCLWFFRYPKIDKLIGGVDMFIAPNISFLAVSNKAKFILTIHDLSFERLPETFSFRRRFWHFIVNPRKLCQEADEIWTVSRSSKWDLENLYKINKEKIKVITPPYQPGFLKEKEFKEKEIEMFKRKYNLGKNIILYLGTIEPRKNLSRLVKSFEYLLKKKLISNDYQLILAGQLGWKYEKILNQIDISPFQDSIILTKFISAQEKKILYKLANIFVYPSIFEGFGVPVFEAMMAETPVVVANNSSLPEIVGECGIMIDPDKENDLIDAMELLANDQELRCYYGKKGKERAQELKKKDYFHNFL